MHGGALLAHVGGHHGRHVVGAVAGQRTHAQALFCHLGGLVVGTVGQGALDQTGAAPRALLQELDRGRRHAEALGQRGGQRGGFVWRQRAQAAAHRWWRVRRQRQLEQAAGGGLGLGLAVAVDLGELDRGRAVGGGVSIDMVITGSDEVKDGSGAVPMFSVRQSWQAQYRTQGGAPDAPL